MRESTVESHIRLDAPKIGVDLWRNNVGVAWYGKTTHLKDGSILIENPRPVRYGLCNESKKQNESVKSSDWIGITPTHIGMQHLGQTLGVFTAIEVKHSDIKFNTNDKHYLAQRKFHDIVLKSGGYAGFANSVETFREIVKK
jgi:hypothetical protein